MENIIEPKKYLTFKQRLAENPEYKAKHMAYIKAKVTCEGCGASIARTSVSKHKLTKAHKRTVTAKKNYVLKDKILDHKNGCNVSLNYFMY